MKCSTWTKSASRKIPSTTLFSAKRSQRYDPLIETCDLQIGSNSYVKVKIEPNVVRTLDPEHVFVMDNRKLHRELPIRYFKNMDPEVDVLLCEYSQHFFLTEEYDMFFNMTGAFPFSNVKIDNLSAANN
jgi:hypothetical protein